MTLKRIGSRAGLLTVSVVAMSALFTGCTPVVDNKDVEDQITQKLTDAGEPPTKVDCPKDLQGKKGATGHCTITLDDTETGVTVTVTSVDGNTVNFNIELDSTEE